MAFGNLKGLLEILWLFGYIRGLYIVSSNGLHHLLFGWLLCFEPTFLYQPQIHLKIQHFSKCRCKLRSQFKKNLMV